MHSKDNEMEVREDLVAVVVAYLKKLKKNAKKLLRTSGNPTEIQI
jgi:hypothetical protein